MIPQYKPQNDRLPEEILAEYPELMNQVVQANAWKEFEGKPNMAAMDPAEARMVPQQAREGHEVTDIESWMLTK